MKVLKDSTGVLVWLKHGYIRHDQIVSIFQHENLTNAKTQFEKIFERFTRTMWANKDDASVSLFLCWFGLL